MVTFVFLAAVGWLAVFGAMGWWLSRLSYLDGRARDLLDVLAIGRSESATVRSLRATGKVTGTRSFEIFEFLLELEITSDDGATRVVTTSQLVDVHRSGAVQPGQLVQLRVDPKNQERVAVSASTTAEHPSPVFDADRVRNARNLARGLTVFLVFGLAMSFFMALVD